MSIHNRGSERSDISKHAVVHQEPKYKCQSCGKLFRHMKNKELHEKRFLTFINLSYISVSLKSIGIEAKETINAECVTSSDIHSRTYASI